MLLVLAYFGSFDSSHIKHCSFFKNFRVVGVLFNPLLGG